MLLVFVKAQDEPTLASVSSSSIEQNPQINKQALGIIVFAVLMVLAVYLAYIQHKQKATQKKTENKPKIEDKHYEEDKGSEEKLIFELIKYVTNQIDSGIHPDTIKNSLFEIGHKPHHIEKALWHAKNRAYVTQMLQHIESQLNSGFHIKDIKQSLVRAGHKLEHIEEVMFQFNHKDVVLK